LLTLLAVLRNLNKNTACNIYMCAKKAAWLPFLFCGTF
jgi:hypothetical protein